MDSTYNFGAMFICIIMPIIHLKPKSTQSFAFPTRQSNTPLPLILILTEVIAQISVANLVQYVVHGRIVEFV